MFKKTTLRNGLRIITAPMRGNKAVTVLILVKTGSKYESKKNNGVSHFVEHMLFKGTKNRPSPLLISELLDSVGGIYNAETGQNYTGYYIKVAASHLSLALDVISDIFLNSLFKTEEINRERKVIIEEANMYLDTPMMYIDNLWMKLLYGDQPAGWAVVGTKKNIRKMNRKILRDYVKKQYVASNTIISLAGDISSSTINQVKKYFAHIRTSKPNSSKRVKEYQTKPKSLIYYKKTDQTHVYLGVRGYNLFHPQKYAFQLLGDILGGMMSSRMFVEVREKRGLAYYIITDTNLDPDSGYLVTRCGVNNDRVAESISAILEQYKIIAQKRISRKELDKAKENAKGKAILSLETSDALASFYGKQELLENRILSLKEIFREIDKVTVNDIYNVASDIFQPNKLNLALIGPFKNKSKFQKLLLNFK